MNETLKQIRINALQYSEKDMANKLNMLLSEYINIENNKPLDIMLLSKLAIAVGKPIEDLLNMQKQEIKFDIKNAFQTVGELKNKLNDFVYQMKDAGESSNLDFQELLNTVNRMTRKPRVAFVGRSDVGKSTLINMLIGSKTVPEAWTPTTSIIVYVKHVSDRPAYCVSNVMIFKSDEHSNVWDDTRLSEEEYTKSFCIAEGDYTILQDYGARQGAKYEETDATSAVVFVESDILNNCDLLDLPGYGTKDREEDDSLLKIIKNVDILVYMSIANGFMRGDDINWLQEELPNLAPIALNNKDLKPLSNLYIVASQAHTVSNGSIEELNTILQKAADRFEKTLSPNYWSNLGLNATSNEFRSRFFTYSTDQESLRSEFEKDLKTLLLKLPDIIKNSVIDYIRKYANEAKTEEEVCLRSFREILSEREKKKKEFEKIKTNEPHRIYKNESEKKKIHEKITDLSKKASIEITNSYNTILTSENIVKIIEKNNWSKKEEDMKQLSAKLSNLLNDSYTSILKSHSKNLSDKIEEYLKNFENTTKISLVNEETKVGLDFNVKASFAGGLAGLATYGALSIWAASLGNLGSYILISKGVSVLAAMGISVGGTAAASAAIAAIGGPIVLALGLAGILASLVFAIFSGGWKKSIANKIIKEYDKKNVLTQYLTLNSKFWDDTENAFEKAAEKLEKDFEEHIAKLKKEVYESNDEDIKANISSCENNIKFYESLLNKL